MIRYVKGNLLDACAEALVNTVNTVGVMGKGIALQFRETFPDNYKVYLDATKRGEVKIGSMLVTKTSNLNGVRFIINFPTKEHWRNPSRIEYIEKGLVSLRKTIQDISVQSIAVPPLGCGNGGLIWEEVRPLIEQYLGDLPVEIILYEPNSAVLQTLQQEAGNIAVKLTPAKAMLLYLLFDYTLLGESICEFSAQKLGYFLQRLGEKQLKLDFQKHFYGPYSNQMAHLLYSLRDVYITGLEQRKNRPFDELGLRMDRKAELNGYVEKELPASERKRLDQVLQLVEGFQSPFGLEVLSTVDYLIAESKSFEPAVIRAGLESWSARKAEQIKDFHIERAVARLREHAALLYPPRS